MTVLVNVGRRVPRSWFKRTGSKVKGLLTFQENIWIIIKQSLNMAKKKANASGEIVFNMLYEKEIEDMNYEIEWMKIVIQGTPDQEQEEYEESLQMYSPLGKILKKEFPKDDRMAKHFKTKVLTSNAVSEAYKKGYGATQDNNMANKLLEMGILTSIEWVDDFASRDVFVKPNKTI
tara:strand:- start:267 stop:794 length:528 start_codon:yes stop_codon:yes gene_type:complete